MLKAIAASGGFSLGTAFVYSKPDLSFTPHAIDDPEAETRRYLGAAAAAAAELASLTERTRGDLGEELAHIFRSQQTMAEDDATRDDVCRIIREKSVCAEQAMTEVFDSYRALFAELGEEDYNKARVADLNDVYKRTLRCLLGKPESDLSNLKSGTILVAEELFPSDTALLDPSKVCGIITERGGITSHAAILAKNLGIPAAVGLMNAAGILSSGDAVVVDATKGDEAEIFLNPTSAELAVLEKIRTVYETKKRLIQEVKGLPAVTQDGCPVTVSANIGSVSEAVAAHGKGADSVGLFRSEFLFIGKSVLPDEEEQFLAYKAVVETFREGFVIIRTLDAGGDKKVYSLSIPEEDNPFLGYRALRVCLDRPDVFEPQLRAILRASHFGKAKIMFPMVSGISEVRAARSALEKCKTELRTKGVPFDENMEVGIMVEIPSAVFLASELAEVVDFFSIGTNDLTQYLLAADRMNARIQAYYRNLDPSVFRAIRTVVEAAHSKGKWVGICGELGGNSMAIPVLVGLGVDELSMSPQLLYEAIYTIRGLKKDEAGSLAKRVLSLDSQEKIATLLNSNIKTEE